MPSRFRLKYASELWGTLVILATVGIAVSVFVAARRQGWFEKRIHLVTSFPTEEGTYGLQEGGEVRIRNTVAGRVGKISPTPDGRMEATLIIPERFRSLIRQEAVAKVSRTYGIAGDAYVELVSGNGRIVEDGDRVKNSKSEEVMEKIQKVIDEIRARGVPLLEETERILANVSGIASNVNSGGGVVGEMLRNRELALDVRETVRNASKALELSQDTIKETTLLIQGLQRHWLVRSYVDDVKKNSVATLPPFAESDKEERLEKRLRDALAKARASDDPRGVSEYAYWVANLALARGHSGDAHELLGELRVEAVKGRENAVRAFLLEGGIAWAGGDYNAASAAADMAVDVIDGSVRDEWAIEAMILSATARFSKGDRTSASDRIRQAERKARRTESAQQKGRVLGAKGAMLYASGSAGEAVKAFDEQVSCYRGIGWYGAMAEALTNAGEASLKAGRKGEAADYMYRAARSIFARQSDSLRARMLAGRALEIAEDGKNAEIAEQAKVLIREIARAPKDGGHGG